MSNLKELKTQIENANALGRQNLTDKGVEVEETATTYDIMSKIAEVSGGGDLLDNTVTFTVDGEPYEIVSVKNGNSINPPKTLPTKEEYKFSYWVNTEGNTVVFPYIPTEEQVFLAEFVKYYSEKFYSYYGVDRATSPYILITFQSGKFSSIYFGRMVDSSGKLRLTHKVNTNSQDFSAYFTNHNDYETIFDALIRLAPPSNLETATYALSLGGSIYYWTNRKDWVLSASAGTYYFD